MLNSAITIAKNAGDYLLSNFRKDASLISRRGVSKEITTKYDIESDNMIISQIQKHYPDHSILSEEGGLIDKKSDHLWIVDSLDGSSNFATGNPFFSVSIGILHKGELLVGVIYAPFLQELYTAEKGKGAKLNGRKIRVSDQADLNNSYIVSCEGGEKDNQRMSELFQKIYPSVKDMRKLGSAAIESGYVASGRAESYATLAIYPWDVSAGVLLVTEAGGQVSDFSGKPWKPVQCDVLMSNGILHDTLLRCINGKT